MKKRLVLCGILFFIFVTTCLYSQLYAQDSSGFNSFEQQVGILLDDSNSVSNEFGMALNQMITGTVYDPSKLGGCKKGDKVKLIKIDENKWVIIHIPSGKSIVVKTEQQGDVLKVSKTSAAPETMSYDDSRPTKDIAHSESAINEKRKLESKNYFSLKGGLYLPTGDLDEFDTGFDGEIAFGHYFSKNWATEFSVGYITTDAGEEESSYGAERTYTFGEIYDYYYKASGDINIIPVSATFKGIANLRIGEIYFGLGIDGFYLDYSLSEIESYWIYYSWIASPGQEKNELSIDESDYAIGAHCLVGGTVDFSESIYIGVEGKYLLTQSVKKNVSDSGKLEFNLDGFTVSGVLGFRF